MIYQTYEDLEIIIIDDGSTDESGMICDEYAARDQRICVIHQENKGLSNARNTGLDRMSGEIVAFLDPDDAYDLTFIEKLKTTMDQEKADLALGKYIVHYTTGKLHRKKKETQSHRCRLGYTIVLICSGLYPKDGSTSPYGTNCTNGNFGKTSDFETGMCARIMKHPTGL